MDESKAPRADVPAMLREMRHEECRCVTASDVGVPAAGNPLVYGECPACSLVGLLADYAAAADALRGRVVEVLAWHAKHGGDPGSESALQDEHKGHDYDLTGLYRRLDAARAALAKALEGGDGC